MRKYIIIEVFGLSDFEDAVNKKIEEGYLPLGGVECPVRDLYTQAMFKEEKSVLDIEDYEIPFE